MDITELANYLACYVPRPAIYKKKIVLHMPGKGFQQIRHYGFYSNKFKGNFVYKAGE